jgi:hypothetical protein
VRERFYPGGTECVRLSATGSYEFLLAALADWLLLAFGHDL